MVQNVHPPSDLKLLLCVFHMKHSRRDLLPPLEGSHNGCLRARCLATCLVNLLYRAVSIGAAFYYVAVGTDACVLS